MVGASASIQNRAAMHDFNSPMNGAGDELDWSLLHCLLAIVEAGSLTAAAVRLGISQPTLTRSLARLEAMVGAELLVRSARGVTTTEAGQIALEGARRMQAAAQSLALDLLGTADRLAGTIRLTASKLSATHLLPGLLAPLLHTHPEIEIEIVASDAVEHLLEGEAHLALRHSRPTQSDLIARHLGSLEVRAFAHADYLARHGGRLDPTRMNEYDWIGYDRSDLLIRGFRDAGIEVGRSFFRFRCDDSATNWQMALAGFGMAFAPTVIAQRFDGMRAALPDSYSTRLPVWIVGHRSTRGSARVKLLRDTLAQGLAPLLDERA